MSRMLTILNRLIRVLNWLDRRTNGDRRMPSAATITPSSSVSAQPTLFAMIDERRSALGEPTVFGTRAGDRRRPARRRPQFGLRLVTRSKMRLTVAGALSLALFATVGAIAYWSTQGTGSATASTGSVGAPMNVNAADSGSTVTISWDGPTTGTITPAGYLVTRSDGSSSVNVCETNPDPSAATTVSPCLDNDVPAGTYTYSVTSYYNGWTSPSSESNSVAVKASPTIALTPSATVTVGGQVSAQAALSGGASPTGSIVFNLYSDTSCTNQVFTSTDGISSANATSDPFTTDTAGTYYWQAVYAGDSLNNGFITPCGPGNALVVVSKDTTTTTVSESPTSVDYGSESNVTFTAGVTTGNGESVPNGDTITVSVNSGGASCTITLPATSCQIGDADLVPGGPYAVSATYNGDTNLSTSTGNAAPGLTVNQIAGTTAYSAPGTYTLSVPAHTAQVNFTILAGGGGGSSNGGAGTAGGNLSGTINLPDSATTTSFTVIVGGGGGAGGGTRAGGTSGTNCAVGGAGGNGSSDQGGGGGGATCIYTPGAPAGTYIAVAGAGGGGGSRSGGGAGGAGNGGLTTANNPGTSTGTTGVSVSGGGAGGHGGSTTSSATHTVSAHTGGVGGSGTGTGGTGGTAGGAGGAGGAGNNHGGGGGGGGEASGGGGGGGGSGQSGGGGGGGSGYSYGTATFPVTNAVPGVGSNGGAVAAAGGAGSASFSAVGLAGPVSVLGVTSSATNGPYGLGAVIPIQVSFTGAVYVTGTPQLTLKTAGTTNEVVNYSGGSGTSTLTFNYTVQPGDTNNDLDYVSTSSLALHGGTISNAAASPATLTLPTPAGAGSLGANKALVVDTTAPTGSITAPAANAFVPNSATVTSNSADAGSGVASALFQYSPHGANTWTTISTDTTSPYSATWNTTALTSGQYDLQVITTDKVGLVFTSPLVTVNVDNTAPTGSITAPADGSTVGGTVAVSSDSADTGSGVASALFQRSPHGANTWTTIGVADTTSPYGVNWDTTGVANGQYDLRVITTDADNNAFTSPLVTVTVSNTFQVTVTSPETAGVAFNATITALAAGVTNTTYTGSHTIAYTGPHNSPAPSNTAPTYPTSARNLTFASGTANATGIVLVDAENATLTATSGNLVGTAAVTVNPAPASKLLFTSVAQTLTAGTTGSPMTVRREDAFSNAATSGAFTINLSTNSANGLFYDPSGLFTITQVSVPDGSSDGSFAYNDTKSGTPTITAASAGLASTTQQETVNGGTAVALTLSATSPVVAGVADNLTVKAVDTFGNASPGYTGTHNLTFGGASTIGANQPTVINNGAGSGTAVNFGSPTSLTFTAGTSTVASGKNGVMKLYKAETANITVTDGSIDNSAAPLPVVVQPAAVGQFIVPNPGPQNVGASFTETITALDAFGNAPTAYTSTTKCVGFSGPGSSPGPVTAPIYAPSGCTATQANITFDASGTGTATITLYKAESPVLTATDTSNGAHSSSTAFTVSPGPFSALLLGTPTVTAGTSFNESITGADQYGNGAPGWMTTTRCFTFAGPGNSPAPSNTQPIYPGPGSGTGCTVGQSAVSFNASGVAAVPITLFNAASTTLTATDVTSSTSGSVTFTVNAAPLNQLQVSNPGTVAAGSDLNVPTVKLSITALDAYSNIANGWAGANHCLKFSGPANAPNTQPPSYSSDVTTPSCTGTNTIPVAFSALGKSNGALHITLVNEAMTTLTVTDASPGNTGVNGAATFQVTSDALQTLNIATPATQTAGVQFAPTITGNDQWGNGFTGTVCVLFSGPANSPAPSNTVPSYPDNGAGTCPLGQSLLTFSNGGAVTPNVKLFNASTTTKITVAQQVFPNLTASTNNFTVSPAAASALAFTTQPGGGSSATVWAAGAQPVVAVQDIYNNTVTGNSSSVALAITPPNSPGGVLTCTANPKAAVSGVATFAGCKIDKLGSYTLTATDGALTSAVSNSFSISTGVASKLAFTTPPSGGTGGSVLTTQPVVTVQDAGGNTVTTDTSNVSLAITTPNGATLTCTTNPLAATSGVATFAGCKIDKAGTYTLTASDGGLTTAQSGSLVITVGTAAKLGFTTQPGGGSPNAVWSTQPVVAVQDAGGNTVTTDSSSVSLAITPPNAPGGVLTCTANPKTAASGVAAFAGCKIDKAGTYTLTATDGSLTSAQSNSVTIAVTPTKLAFTNPPNGGNGGAVWTSQPVVAVQDASGNTVTTDTSNVSLAITTPNGATLSCTTNPLAATAGVATFAGCKIGKSGTYTLTATDGSLTAATSTSFTITVGPMSQFLVTAPATGTAGTQLTGTAIKLTAADAGGNTITSYTGSHSVVWSGAGTSPGGNAPTYPNGTVSFTNGVSTTTLNATLFAAGSNNLTATSAGITGTAVVIINAAGPAKLTLVNCLVNNAPVTCSTAFGPLANGSTLKANLQVTDNFGNVQTEAAATDVDLSVSVNPTRASVSPATVTVPAGGSQTPQFTVTKSSSSGATIDANAVDGNVIADFTFTV